MSIICDVCNENCWEESDSGLMKHDITLNFHDFQFQVCINCAYGLGTLIQEKNKELKDLVTKTEQEAEKEIAELEGEK